jgi:hypothetical protein
MNKEFIPYTQALALRELGFNEPCFTTYDDDKRLRNPFDYEKSEDEENISYIEDSKEFIHNSDLTFENFNGHPNHYTQFITAPLYQQAFRWFREKHGWVGGIRLLTNSVPGIIGEFTKGKDYSFMIIATTYEEAELACLNKLIELIKNK